MCGIVAIVRARGLDLHERSETLERMTSSLAHRGPDEASHRTFDDWVAFGHRRLSIVDVAGSSQPLRNEDGTIQCIFNGEVYNFQPLRERLQGLGHEFSTRGDGEVIVHGYEQWGDEVVAMLEGMFAFVLLDRRRQSVLVARDRFGIKPVFWTRTGGGYLVASELKAVVAHPSVEPTASPLALELGALRMNVPWPLTAFHGIYRLPPGATLTIRRNGEHALRRFALIVDPPRTSRPVRADEAEVRALAALESAVGRQMVADVPVGCFLSGGIDSTLIATLMRRRTSAPIHTFSLRTSVNDESAIASETARRLGTRHHIVDFDALGLDDLSRLPAMYDEPFAETSALGVRVLSAAAREHVKVALSGDGGDEIFAGYDTTRWVVNAARSSKLLPDRLSSWAGRRAGRILAGGRYPERLRQALRFAALYGGDSATAHRRLTTLAWSVDPEAARRSYDLSHQIERLASSGLDGIEASRAAMATDRLERLPNAMLTKVDIASMSVSLEVRVPMLDDALARFADTQRSDTFVGLRRGKLLLRRVLERLLPGGPAWAPKQGFPLPLPQLMRQPKARSMLDELFGDRASLLRELAGVDIQERWTGFLEGRTAYSAGSAAQQLLWYSTVALWADRFRVSQTAVDVGVEELPLV
jgi:asparagine synthase (glutamine-hydrolysing)